MNGDTFNGEINLTLTLFSCTAFEDAVATAYADVIDGNIRDNVLDGQKGNDTLRGSFNNDILLGREGDDSLVGDLGGDDTLKGNWVLTMAERL